MKYAVDNIIALGLSYLDDEGILGKMVTAHKNLTADGTAVELRLATNRTGAPTDLSPQQRDGRNQRLLPRVAEGGSTSAMGKARAAWATAAGTNEAALLSFLDDFYLDIAYDLLSLRSDVGLLMTANGLRSDEKSVDLSSDWVAKQVIAGHRNLTLDDIKNAETVLDLNPGSPWTPCRSRRSRRSSTTTSPTRAAVSIDWVDRIAGEKHWNRVAPTPPHTWAELASDIATVPMQLGGSRRILVGGHMRQATGFMVGAVLRSVLGYEVGVRQSDQIWTSEETTTPFPLDVTEESVDAGPDIAVIVNISYDAASQATEWIRRTELPVATIVTATPSTGTGPKVVPTPAAANSLAVEIRNVARRYASSRALHGFLIGPLGLAVLMGHHWNRVTTTHVCEHLGGQDYVHAFTVDA
ncbi:SAVED domain-containing protein [Rhodococcoides fascians]|uniref:SAVED domain-containing protein n=1 Tax=Rhodococcoides fascians TaxID=1828 RepID=UPI0006901583|nr:SAVED domain-containing protein [Rhodococcus fascians]